MEKRRPRIPGLVSGVDLRALPLSPLEGFVVSRIDGAATVQDLADLTNLDLPEVERTVAKLVELGAVEWADGAISLPRTSHRPATPADAIRRFPVPSTTPPRPPMIRAHVMESEPPKAMREPQPVRIASSPLPKVETSLPSDTVESTGRPDSAIGSSAAGANVGRIGARSSPSERVLKAAAPSAPPASTAAPTSGPASGPPPSARTPTPGAPTPAPAPTVSSATASSAPASTPTPSSPAGEDGIELAPERRERIDELFPLIAELDHYEVLDIERSADVKAVRAAYFELSKVFHPDTAFRKNLGPYKARMEAIFSRLTEAYDVLGKKKLRTEYDGYLALQSVTREAEAALRSPSPRPVPPRRSRPAERAPASASSVAPDSTRTSTGPAATAAPSTPVPTTPVPTAAPTTPVPTTPVPTAPVTGAPEARTTLSDEGKRQARDLLRMRLGGPRSSSGGPRSVTSDAPDSSAPRGRGEVLRDLASSLKGAAAQTGGLDAIQRHVLEARRAEQQGDLASAAREMRLAVALAPDREDVKAEQRAVAQRLALTLADQYRKQAEYEERHRKWAPAALSWAKVVEGRPDDVEALIHGATALVEAKGDLHTAQRFAGRACELFPEDVIARRTLGRVYIAAGLNLNARRELERAATLDPADQIVKNLLRELKG